MNKFYSSSVIIVTIAANLFASDCLNKKELYIYTFAKVESHLIVKLKEQDLNHFEVIRPVKQPKSMDCWATALTMLYSWKYNDNSIKIEDVVGKYGNVYFDLFKNNKGVNPSQEEELYKAAKLTVIKGSNPTIPGWYDLLKKHGPLSITVDAAPPLGTIHALVVNGIKGDGTPDKTFIDFVDPANGKQNNLKFSEFIKLYEGSASWPLQIIHW